MDQRVRGTGGAHAYRGVSAASLFLFLSCAFVRGLPRVFFEPCPPMFSLCRNKQVGDGRGQQQEAYTETNKDFAASLVNEDFCDDDYLIS